MSTAVAENKKEEVTDEIIEKLDAKEKEGFKRGELKILLESLAEQYDLSFTTIKNKYYKFIKGKYGEQDKRKTKGKNIKIPVEENTDKKDEEKSEEQKKITLLNSVQETARSINKEEEERKKPSSVNIDESIQRFHEEVPKDNYIKPNKPPYKYGQLVTCEVINIVSYGCFLEIKDGYGYQGLLHVSEIKNGFVESINDFFDIGDEIKVKIKLAQSEDRIQFSTKDLKLTKKTEKRDWAQPQNPPINNLGEKLQGVKDRLALKPKKITEEEYTRAYQEQEQEEQEREEQSNTPTLTEKINAFPTVIDLKEKKELDEMTKYLNNIVGALSPRAKEDLYNLLNENGVFKSTIAISEVSKEFDVDLGVIFLQRVREKMGGCL